MTNESRDRAGNRRPLHVAVIGCGYWGPNLVRNFARNEGSRVITVCDSRAERAAAVAREYGVESSGRPDEVVRRPDVDLVVVATPSFTHHSLARAAIEAGKHVLVTKPLTTTVGDAEDLVELARRRGVVLAVDHTFVYHGAVRKMRELAAAGDLGEIYYVDSVRINLGAFQHDVNVLWDLAPHDVSIIDFVLGGTAPVEVSAVAAAHAGSVQENIAYLTMRYPDGALAHVHVNWLAPAKIRRTIVGGSRRMVVYDDMEPSEKVRIYDKGVTITASSDDEVYSQLVSYRSGDMHAPQIDTREALAVEVEHLLECIAGGGTPVADGQAGLRAVRILEAAQASVDRQKALEAGAADSG